MCFTINNKISEVTHSSTPVDIFPEFALIEYFNFFYYLGQFPFRFQYSPQLRRYVIRTNFFQQVSLG